MTYTRYQTAQYGSGPTIAYERIPRARKLRCPICKSSHHLVSSVLAEHILMGYTSHFSESMGHWSTENEIRTNRTLGLYLACTECLIFGTEDFFDPRAKPPKLYHDRKGYYVKIRLPCDMGPGLFENIELKCYIRTSNTAGLTFIGLLKVASVKTAAELPEFLVWPWPEIVEYAKVRLREFRAAAQKKKKKKSKRG